jgi:hypothetical protein
MTIKIVEPKVANNPAEYIIKTDKLKEKEKLKKYFEENYLKNTCFDTLDGLLKDKTLVEVNAPRALIAVELIGVWKGLNDKQFEQKEIERLNKEIDGLKGSKRWYSEEQIGEFHIQINKQSEEINQLKPQLIDSLEIIGKIRARVTNQIHRKDGAYDQTAEDIRKSLLENDLCDKILIFKETGTEYPCSFKRNHKGLHSFEDSRNIKDSLENEKEKGGIITIHSVDVVTPELISKSMFPKKKDDKK